MRTWHYVTDDEPKVSALDMVLDTAVETGAATAAATGLDDDDQPQVTLGVAIVDNRAFGVQFDWRTREMLTAWCNLEDGEPLIKRLEGGVVCLAHSSIVSGDQGICERVEGDLAPELDDDELMCGPFRAVLYEDTERW